jgi:hypothetical protein
MVEGEIMTTKERCLEALKDNEFFQSAMKKGKMICITHTYEPWIVEEGFIFGNQYNAFNSEGRKERMHDAQLCCIFNDKRLKDFYVCSQGQGTYEECKAKIAEYRSHIRQCKNCDGNGRKCCYWQCTGTVESDTTRVYDDATNKEIITKTTIYQYGCTYTQRDYHPTLSNCAYDIEDEPKLCTDVWKKDYFVQNPDGIPNQIPLREFMVRHADKFDIVPRYTWSTDPISANNGFKYAKRFGSYILEADPYSDTFKLSNARNTFVFRYDMNKHVFILGGRYHNSCYDVVRTFTELKYDYHLQKPVSQSIACWDKFIKWWHSVIDAYLDEIN